MIDPILSGLAGDITCLVRISWKTCHKNVISTTRPDKIGPMMEASATWPSPINLSALPGSRHARRLIICCFSIVPYSCAALCATPYCVNVNIVGNCFQIVWRKMLVRVAHRGLIRCSNGQHNTQKDETTLMQRNTNTCFAHNWHT